MTQDMEMEVLFPGRVVKIKTAKGEVDVTVYPMPIEAFRRFKESCLSLIDVFNKAGGSEILGGGWQSILPVLLPVVVDEYLDLLAECVDGVDLLHKRCPQHLFPLLAKEWIFESFGTEEKLRPWTDLIGEVLTKVTGDEVDLWSTLSSSLSQQATTKLPSGGTESESSKPTFPPSNEEKEATPQVTLTSSD